MTNQLALYNGALSKLGERQLASLGEARAPRRYLDVAWNGGDGNSSAIAKLLAMGQWKFAQRSVQLAADTNLTTQFGLPYAFAAPTDFVRTTRACVDEFFVQPLEQYEFEDGVFYAFIQTFYLSYVSNDANYGSNLAKWPANFTEFAEYWLASQILASLTGNKTDKEQFTKDVAHALRKAEGTDAMEWPTKYPPRGSWANARTRGRVGGWDGGPWTRLIG